MDDPSTSNAVVEQFLASRQYTFPVLRGSAYARQAGVWGTPTTLFVNAKGDIVFEKSGYSQHLDQEFDWRLQAMEKHSRPQATASGKTAAGGSGQPPSP